jgi:guanylate kinase
MTAVRRTGPARRGLGLVIAAPSGAGKSSIARTLLREEGDLHPSVSVTTRPPRPGEEEGVHYFFRTQAEFDVLAAAGGLLEWATVFGRSYGTPRAPVDRALADGRDIVFDIDWQGHRQLRAALPGDIVSVYVLPPSLAALEERIRARGDRDGAEIARRMDAARAEISHWHEFDHVVINDSFEHAVAAVRAVLNAARSAIGRQSGLADFVARLTG